MFVVLIVLKKNITVNFVKRYHKKRIKEREVKKLLV